MLLRDLIRLLITDRYRAVMEMSAEILLSVIIDRSTIDVLRDLDGVLYVGEYARYRGRRDYVLEVLLCALLTGIRDFVLLIRCMYDRTMLMRSVLFRYVRVDLERILMDLIMTASEMMIIADFYLSEMIEVCHSRLIRDLYEDL